MDLSTGDQVQREEAEVDRGNESDTRAPASANSASAASATEQEPNVVHNTCDNVEADHEACVLSQLRPMEDDNASSSTGCDDTWIHTSVAASALPQDPLNSQMALPEVHAQCISHILQHPQSHISADRAESEGQVIIIAVDEAGNHNHSTLQTVSDDFIQVHPVSPDEDHLPTARAFINAELLPWDDSSGGDPPSELHATDDASGHKNTTRSASWKVVTGFLLTVVAMVVTICYVSRFKAPSSPLFLPNLPLFTWKSIHEMPHSPQAKAYQWLTHDPASKTYSEKRLIQRLALATLYYATNGDSWHFNTGWLSYDISECEWYFKTYRSEPLIGDLSSEHSITACSVFGKDEEVDHNAIHMLLLESNNLPGNLPPELYLLTSLRLVYLGSNNDLNNSNISTLIGNLSRLMLLNLDNCGIGGAIPSELGKATELQKLSLSNNALQGPIPSDLFRLTNMQSLTLDDTSLSGTLSTKFGLLTALTSLSLSQINDRVTYLSSLFMYYISLDAPPQTGLGLLIGEIPTELGLLTNLESLQLFNNRFQGFLPSELGLLTSLTWLDVGFNSLSGLLPMELGLLTGLTGLRVANNKFTGSIPSQIGLLTFLNRLFLSDNQLTGALPTELGLTSLLWLSLGGNDFFGAIPEGLDLFQVDCHPDEPNC